MIQRGLLALMVGVLGSCGPEAPPERSDAMIVPDCANGGPVPPRGAGENAMTFGQLECQGLVPAARGIAPPTPECRATGGTETTAFTSEGMSYVCCMVQNRGARGRMSSICLPGEFG